MKRTFRCKVGAAVVAAAFATAAFAGTAFAAYDPGYVEAMDTEGYVTSATTPASQPVPEILGICSIEESNATISSIPSGNWNDSKYTNKYILMGLSKWNVNANPYFNNVWAGSGLTPVYNEQHDGMTPKVTRPMAALLPYADVSDGGGDQAVWNMLPDIIIGCRTTSTTTTDYTSSEYAPAAGAANGDPDYSPIAIDYNMSSLSSIVNNAYLTADAADTIVANSNGTKKLRYGNATAIVKQYEAFVKGSQGYVLKQLAENDGAEQKTFAVVSAYADGTYTLTATPETWGSNTRIIEALSAVANNYGDEATTATLDDLKNNVDLIIINNSDTATITASLGDAINKAYWVDGGSTTTGQIYHNASNSMDVATHYARIMGCLYNEYLDQDEMVAYWFQTIYHVKASALGEAIDYAMDGVRNWDVTGTAASMTEWTEESIEGYNQAEIAAKLASGVEYINNLDEATIEEMGEVDYALVALNENFGGSAGVVSSVADALNELPVTSEATASDIKAINATVSAYNGLNDAEKVLLEVNYPEAAAKAEYYTKGYAVMLSSDATSVMHSGATVKVSVYMSGLNIASASAALSYDKNDLELVGITASDSLSGTNLNVSTANEMFSFIGNEGDLSEGATIATFEFKCKNVSAKTSVSLDASKVTGSTSGATDEIDFSVSDTPVTFSIFPTSAVKGDVNYNGKINIIDAQVDLDLANGIYGEDYSEFPMAEAWNASTVLYVGDVNDSGDITALDSRMIQAYLHGAITEL